MPWPLTPEELSALFANLECLRFEDALDEEEPRVRRLRAAFRAA